MDKQTIGTLLIGFAGFSAFLLFHFWRKTKVAVDKTQKSEAWPYEIAREGHLMTDGEWNVHERLLKAMPGCHVFAQVALSHLLQVKESAANAKGGDWEAKLEGVVVDFVVCNKEGQVLAVVELGNASESQDEQRRANEDKDKALKAAEVRVFRWTMRTMPKSEDINKQILAPKKQKGDYMEISDDDHEDKLPTLS